MLTNKEIRYVLLLVAVWNIVIIAFVCTLNKGTVEKKVIGSVVEKPAASEPDGIGEIAKKSVEPSTFSKEKPDKVTSSMTDMYASLLIGDYSLENGVEYKFSSDGKFAGYFDDRHTDVKGYYYEVALFGEDNVVNIYNKAKTSVVTYYIAFSEEADIVLYYPEANVKFTLES